MDPAAEAGRIGIDLNAFIAPGTISAASKQVLAGSNALGNIAESHSGLVQSSGVLNTGGNPHDGTGDGTADSRVVNAGYVNWRGENIGWNPATSDEAGLAKIIEDNLFKDDPSWNHGTPGGHRLNILNDNFREVGIGVVRGNVGSNANSMIVTEDFGTALNSKTFLTGVVYNDTTNDDFYGLNEGVQGVTATVTSGATTIGSDTTGSGGGWAVGTLGGTFTITYSGGGLAAPVSVTVEAGARNAKADLVNGNEIWTNVNATLGAGAKELHLLGMDSVNATGNAAANVIVGNKGANLLNGGGGGNSIDGADGDDTAIFSGNFADYQVQSKTGNQVVLVDLRSGSPDGTDTIKNVEHFRFADKTVDFSALQAAVVPVAGSVRINDMSIAEGNNGTQVVTFTVTRSDGTAAFDVNVATTDGSAAVADGDYVAVTTTPLHFAVNEITKTISVTIKGDTKVEATETFKVVLSNATNGATISDAEGLGTITNDDANVNVNHAPVVTGVNASVAANSSLAVSSLFAAHDQEGDNTITKYAFWDGGNGGGHFTVNGVDQASGQWIYANAGDLSSVKYVGGASAGSETLWGAAYDGQVWSDNASVTATTTARANTAPVATINDHTVSINEWAQVKNWLSYSDAEGNAATKYQFWDGNGGASSGYFWTPDNAHNPAGTAIDVAASDLSNVWVRGGTAGGSETMYVRAFDGADWGAWDSFNFTTKANTAPVATINDHSLHVNEWAQVKNWLSYSDADGNAASQFQFWDGNAGASGGYIWTPTNAHNPAGTAIDVAASDLGNVWVRGGTTGGSETMYVRAFDGIDWGTWDAFNFTTLSNNAPVATASDHSLHTNEWSRVNSWVSYADADGNAATKYQFWDGNSGASSGYIWTPDNAHNPAGTAIEVLASELDNVWVRGGAAAGDETMYVRAFDGMDWGAWDSFQLHTIA